MNQHSLALSLCGLPRPRAAIVGEASTTTIDGEAKAIFALAQLIRDQESTQMSYRQTDTD